MIDMFRVVRLIGYGAEDVEVYLVENEQNAQFAVKTIPLEGT